MNRSAELQRFLVLSKAALVAATQSDAARAAARINARLGAQAGDQTQLRAERLAVCEWVEPALTLAADGPRADLAAAFAAIEGRLAWRRRLSSDPADTTFWNGHANAMILGPGGLEERSDIWIGVTVMAPGVTYADHDHPPEEVYLPLVSGEWWNAKMDWTDPGATGAIYNPPGILHKMRAGKGPFLALWYLPV